MVVNGIPLLHRVCYIVKKLDFIDEVMVATSQMEADDPIEAVAKQMGVNCFRGSALDVLDRFVQASADMMEDDIVVRFTADNPLNYPEASEEAFHNHVDGRYDYTHIHRLSHIVPEFIRVSALREAGRLAKTDFDREHATPFFRKNLNIFKVLELPNTFKELRPELDKYLTIDTLEELLRFEKMLQEIEDDNRAINIGKVYKYLDENVLHYSVANKKDRYLELDGTPVGDGFPTYIVAEIGQNHNGDIMIAKKLIDMSAQCGADAVKFQKRDMSCELTSEAFNNPYDNPNSFGKTYGEHRTFLEFNEEQHKELKEYSQAARITYFVTPCDIPSVEMMERIGVPFYKVASRDITNIPLLEKLAETGKPIIISTGMADKQDIEDALNAIGRDNSSVIIMQCTSEYPLSLENVNLRAINTIRHKFGFLVGLSDHHSGIITAVAASLMGACIVEKHITLSRAMKGSDHAGSLERWGLEKLVDYIRAVELAMGNGKKEFNLVARPAKEKLARSLTSKVHIDEGTALTEDMLCLKSPGTGIKWRDKGLILGKIAKRDIPADVTLKIEDFE